MTQGGTSDALTNSDCGASATSHVFTAAAVINSGVVVLYFITPTSATSPALGSVVAGATATNMSTQGAHYATNVLAHQGSSSNLAAYYRMGDAPTCSALHDSGPSSLTAAVSGGVVCGGSALLTNAPNADSGTSATFNGSSGLATLASSSSLSFEYTQAITVDAIIKPTSVSGETFFIGKELSSGNYTGWAFGQINGVLEFLEVSASGTSHQLYAKGSITMTAGNVYHVSVYYDGGGSAQGVHFEVNGAVDPDVTIGADTLANNSVINSIVPTIGVRGTSGAYSGYFSGQIQELAVYTDAPVAPPAISGVGAAVAVADGEIFLGHPVLAAAGPSSGCKIIVDDDTGDTDIDGVAELALLSKLVKNGECSFVGNIESSSNPSGIAADRAIINWMTGSNTFNSSYFGCYKGSDLATSNSFSSQVVTNFGATYAGGSSDSCSNYQDSVNAYRSWLSSASPGSVTIVLTGAMEPFNNFLNSTADCGNCGTADAINKTGIQLLAAVKNVVIEAGYFPSAYYGPGAIPGGTNNVCCSYTRNPSYNFSTHSTSAVAQSMMATLAANNISVQLVGDEEGATVFLGPASGDSPSTNPVKYAFNLYAAANTANLDSSGRRDAWGSLAVLFGVRGFGPNTSISPGTLFESYWFNSAMTLGSDGSNTNPAGSGFVSNLSKTSSDSTLTALLAPLIEYP